MLSKHQQKGVNTGVSFWAVSQILIALGIIVLWGRSLVKSFDNQRPGAIPTMQLFTLPANVIQDRLLTPTATVWAILPEETATPTPSPTPEITITPWVVTATPSPTPEITPTMWFEGMYIPDLPGIAPAPSGDSSGSTMAKLSYYYPPYAYLEKAYEINCDVSGGVLECEHMSNGQEVKYFIGEALACPQEYPFGTVFKVMDGYYTCRDRGGAIGRVDDSTIWLDLLYPYMPNNVNWGYLTEVEYWIP